MERSHHTSAMADSEEFEEEEVWAGVKERVEVSPKTSTTRRGAKAIPRSNASVEIVGRACQQSSAPVTIPDWSKFHVHAAKDSEDDDEDDDDDVKKVPPHEWLAKKLARSQISSFSVCEGAGRTLKGRDLSRVRNAVLTRTGFLE